MKNKVCCIIIIFLFISCGKEIKRENTNIETKPVAINYKKELKSYFKTNFKLIDTSSEISNFSLDTIYKSLDYNLLWINDSLDLNQKANRFLDSIVKVDEYGLSSSYYNLSKIQKLKLQLQQSNDDKDKFHLASYLELLLSNSYTVLGRHLHYGVLDSIDSITTLPKKDLKVDFKNYLLQSAKSDNLIDALFELQPKSEMYKKLQYKLSNYVRSSSLSTDNINVINFRKDSLLAISLAQKALVLHGYLDSISADTIYNVALKKFQKNHGLKPDGLVGSNTAKALSKSPYRYYQTLVANLERWRWKKELPNDYLFANIPGFNVRFIKNNKIEKEYRTVVGKYKNQTPEIRDSLLSVIAYPYWYVPKKISLEEIFVKAQKDSTYFKRNNFEIITYQKEPISYDSLQWDEINNGKFNYLVRQGGGWSNSLGLVKFIFPNKRAIYLHDSPSKSLYYREKRAYSHGCVRVQNALKLADDLLAYDKNEKTIDTVKKYIAIKKEKKIKLNKRLPVLLYYFTAEVDENDDLIIYDDIYDKDRIILEQIRILNKS